MIVFDVLSGPLGAKVVELMAMLNENVPKQAQGLLNTITDKAYELWYEEARSVPTGWGEKYAQAITVEPAGPNGGFAKIYVDDGKTDPRTGKPAFLFVNLVEDGMKSFSIKEGLMKSDRVRTMTRKRDGKSIKFIIVPFRHRTPKKGQAPASGFADVMPDDVYKIAKSGTVVRGEKYGKLSGLKRYDNEGGGHGQFLTFRMVTEESKGWQHPGKGATPVFDKVLEHVERMIAKTLQAYAEAMLKRIEAENK